MFYNVAYLYKLVPLVCKFKKYNQVHILFFIIIQVQLSPNSELASCLIYFEANCFWYLLLSCTSVISGVIWNVGFKENGENIYLGRWEFGPMWAIYQLSEHGWNKCVRNGWTGNGALGRAHSLPQPPVGIPWAVSPMSDRAYTSCHELLQGLIKYRFKSPGLRLHRDSSSCLVQSSGAVTKGTAVWFIRKRQGRNKWLLYQTMLCGSLGRKHPGASESQMTGMGIVTERSPQMWV